MTITVKIYTGQKVSGVRYFKRLHAAHAFIARIERGRDNRRAWIDEVTR